MIKKYRIYLRLTKKGKVVASTKPKFESLKTSSYGNYFPTIQIALDLLIDEKEFDGARILLEKKIKSSQPCVDIKEVNSEEVKQEAMQSEARHSSQA